MAWLVSVGLPVDVAHEACPSVHMQTLTDLAEATRTICEGLDPVAQVALRGAMDPALAKALVDSLGEQVWDFVDASNQRASVILRVNTLCGDVELAEQVLAKDSIQTERCGLGGLALRVVGSANVQGSNALRRGLVEVQDEGSQLLAELVRPTGRVVDYCAGAGGKTLALAAMAPDARLLALDVRRKALDELRKRARRAEARGITVGLLQEFELPPFVRPWLGAADRVLVDAPCSGTGTLRRHPERRLSLGADALNELRALQLRIIHVAARLVAPGGELIYGTCSVLNQENDDIVSAFLRADSAFSLVPTAALIGDQRAAQIGDGQVLRLTPHEHGTDGFFGAVLRRRV